MLWVDKILFLAIHLQLCLIARSIAEVARFLLLHVLLGSPAFVGASAVLGESMAVPHSVALSLREVVLSHHAWAEQTVEIFLI